MGETIRGINIVIDGDTTGLGKALGGINKQAKDIQSELKQVEKLLKLDPRNTELLAQKQQLLSDAVANTKAKLDSLKAAQQQVNEQFARGDISAGQHRAFQREVAKSETEVTKLEKQLTRAEKASEAFALALALAHDRLGAVGDRLTSVGKRLSLHLSAPVAAAGAAVLALAVKTGQWADELGDLADQTGQSTDTIQEWRHVAVVAGVSTDAVADAVLGLTRKMADVREGGGRASDMFADLGVKAEDARDNLRSSDEIMDDLIRSLAAIENPLRRNSIGAKLFGGAWKELAPILAMGQDGIAAARKEAQELGLVMSGDAVKSAGAFEQAMARVREALDAAARSAGERIAVVLNDKLVPLLQEKLVPLIERFADGIARLVEWFAALDPGLQSAIAIAAGLAIALGPVLTVLGFMATGLAALLSPVGLVVLGIAALIAIGVQLWLGWDNIVWLLKDLWARFAAWITGVWETIKLKAAKIALAIATPFINTANWLTEKWLVFGEWWSGWWDRLAAWVSKAVDKVVAPIRTIIDWVKEALDWLDKVFGGTATVKTGIPQLGTAAVGNIPTGHSGGQFVVPGGGEALALLKHGEFVTPPGAGLTAGPFTFDISAIIQAPSGDGRDIAETFRRFLGGWVERELPGLLEDIFRRERSAMS